MTERIELERRMALQPYEASALAPLSDNPDDYCFIDTETRSTQDVTQVGVHRHMDEGRVILVPYAIGDGPVQLWGVENFTPAGALDWRHAPADLRAFRAKADRGEGWFAAWNSGFDRHALNRGLRNAGDELVRVPMMIDVMAQAVKSHLPPDLMGAAQFGGAATKKRGSGKALIKLFSDGHGTGTPQSHPHEWTEFCEYAVDDVAAMRDLFFSTLPLTRAEWAEFWANEYINDRGMAMDEPFVARAAALAAHAAALADSEVRRISEGKLRTVNQHAAMLDWIDARLGHLPQTEVILTREINIETSEDGEDYSVVKKSLERTRVEHLIAMLETLDEAEGLTDEEYSALEMLEVRLYGASATPKKFGKALGALHHGRLKGQYVFNGAPATGRFSSRGVQTHNLTRATVGSYDDEIDAIATISAMELPA